MDGPNRRVVTASTSSTTADVSDVILRDGNRRRLIFRPTLIINPNDPAASVNGQLIYQAKKAQDGWVDIDGLNLTSVKAGEWTKVDLRSAETLKLYQALSTLYDHVRKRGIVYGEQELVPVDKSEVLDQVLAMLATGDRTELIQTFLTWAQSQDMSALAMDLQSADANQLLNFDAAVSLARLHGFVEEARASIENSDEAYWQALLARESWVISQVYAQPLVIINQQAYVGGKSIENRGGSVVDYLFANELTTNVLLVEIKTPVAVLLRSYRGNVMAPAPDLNGGVQQLLQARHSFQEEYRSLVGNMRTPMRVTSPRALLIAGTFKSLAAEIAQRSFELFRANCRDVDIITFDELIAKAEQLMKLLEG